MIQITELAYQASILVLAVAGLVSLPLLAVCGGLVIFHKTRAYGGVILWLFSWLVGLSTWLLGAAFTFGSFGWIGLIVGLLLFGIGVVPLGVFGAVRQGELSFAGGLLAMAVGTYVIRICAAWAMSSADEAPL